MKKSPTKKDAFEKKADAGNIVQLENEPAKPVLKRRRPKRDGCVSVSLAGNAMTSLAGAHTTKMAEEKFVEAALAGNAGALIEGKFMTALAGGAITSLAGYPGTSLLFLTKEEIPQGTVIKETDLVAYLVSEPVTGLDKSVIMENPVGRVARKSYPAYGLVASVVLAGTPSTPVSVIKIPAGALVYRASRPIPKGTIIQEADLEPYLISPAIKNPDMYVSMDDLVGKVAVEYIPEHRIIKKPLVKKPKAQ